ncbi:invasion associated locus B family protein [Alphaproteobacteria bacterium]|nr:invasion associated locus B family protein [Alphaproteobacteria bacterium]
MKNYLTFLIFIIILAFASLSLANVEKGKWNFVKETEYCFIGSAPIETDIPEGKQRGITYILVYRINKSKDAIVQIAAGYPYKKEQNVSVTIDNSQFDFYSDDDAAWFNDDNKVIYAMKKGIKLTVKGESSRGTKTTDIYTLKGFTAAYNQLFNDC